MEPGRALDRQLDERARVRFELSNDRSRRPGVRRGAVTTRPLAEDVREQVVNDHEDDDGAKASAAPFVGGPAGETAFPKRFHIEEFNAGRRANITPRDGILGIS